MVTQLEQRTVLDLANTLTRDTEHISNYLERHRLVAVQAEVHAQYASFTRLEYEKRLMHRLDERLFEHLFVGEKPIRVCKMVDERVVLARRHWRVEREMRVRDCQCAGDFFFCYSEAVSDLEMRGLSAEILQ